MQVYQTDDRGFFLGVVKASPDPRVPDNWLIPAGCVTEPPPEFPVGLVPKWNGQEWVAAEPVVERDPAEDLGDEIPEPTPEEAKRNAVAAERQRRLAANFEFGGKLYQRDPISLQRIDANALMAKEAIQDGAEPGDLDWHPILKPFGWIASDDSLTEMDAHTMVEFAKKAFAVEVSIIFAARQLRNMDPMPDPETWEGWP